MPEISIVVPIFNECDNLDALVREVGQAMSKDNIAQSRGFELILVDDGSSDGYSAIVKTRIFHFLASRGLFDP